MDGKKLRSHIKWSVILLLPIIIVWGVRLFVLESYKISTSAMETTLQPNDFVLVNKIQRNKIQRNYIWLYKSPLQKDSANTSLFISRSIGLPGDTLFVDEECFLIKGKLYPRPKAVLLSYVINRAVEIQFYSALNNLKIPKRNLHIKQDSLLYFSLTKEEEIRLKNYLPDALKPHLQKIVPNRYQIIIPQKDRFYRITPESLVFYREAIRKESHNKAKIKEGKLFLDGKETSFFFFKNDYFWMLSDNPNEAIDSRHLGIIPESNLIGYVWCKWMDSNKKLIFHNVNE